MYFLFPPLAQRLDFYINRRIIYFGLLSNRFSKMK